MTRKILVIGIASAVLVLTGNAQAQQSLEVLSPYVVKGEAEIETQGALGYDRTSSSSQGQDIIGSFGYSPNTYWRSELESEFERSSGPEQKIRYSSINSENTFELTEPGEYWIDTAVFAELDVGRDHTPDNTLFGLLVGKTVGHVEGTANFLLHKDFGGNQGLTPLGFAYSDQTKYRIIPAFEPGIEIYGDTQGREKFADQQLSVGPGIFGKIPTYDAQALKYQLAYLRGATPATPDNTVRWLVEYEFYF